MTWDPVRARLQRRARYAVRRAIQKGDLHRDPCAVCGRTELYGKPVDAHHEDYTRPLDVIWLCRFHHVQLHNGSTVHEMRADQLEVEA